MKKKLFLLAVTLMAAVAAFAQPRQITGKVADANGEPLIGVGIVVKGTTTGTMTDVDGNFALNVPEGAILEISSIGYATQEIPVGDRTKFDIVLEEDVEMIEGTVVVGYGTTKRENFTGSVTTFKVADSPVSNTMRTNAMDFLRGNAPGVSMSQSGVAGASPSIQVRGQKSIAGGSMPLIVLDGVIFKGSLNDIDPNMVESMSVMKDATSLAAYGSQAANGVIMITSKKGQKGKPMINFRANVGLSEQNYHPDYRDGYEYLELLNNRNNLDPTSTTLLSELELANYNAGKQTDWVKYVSQTGVQQEYSLNVSGASDRVNYMVGASFNDNVGFIKGNEFIRETITGRINTTVTDYISFGMNFNYSETQNDGVRPNYSATRSTPWGEPELSDGRMRKYIDGKELDTVNPLWNVYNGRDYESRGNGATLGGNLDIKIPWVKGLSYRLTGNFTRRKSVVRDFTHETNWVDMALGEAGYTTAEFDKFLNKANGSISHTINTSWVIDNILTYNREIGDHYINATLVYTRDSNESQGDSMSGEDFSGLGNTNLGVWNLGSAGTVNVGAPTYSLHTDIGYLARVNYSFRNKYHFNASFRRDGSSVFGEKHKWGNFPAVGAAWTITDEPFMKGIKGLDYLKLKASWGKNGNQSLSPYGTLSRMSMGKTGGYTYFFGDTPVFGQTMTTLGNPNLGWETTTSFNYGFESDFFNRKLHWEVDAYTSKTTDQIFSRTIPVMGAGITSQQATMGQVNNWGIESVLRYDIIQKKDFRWNVAVNFSMNRNKLVELYGDGNDDITNNLFLGKSLGAIYGYRWIGIVQESDTEYISKEGVAPGEPKFADLDGDGKITPEDREILGYNKEAFRASLNTTLTWKNFSLYMMFNGIFSGGKYGVAQNNLAYISWENMQFTNMLDHPFWTPENKSEVYPRSISNDGKLTALQKYGFVRLQDVSLSYNLAGNWLRKIGVSSAQVYVSGRNLFFVAPGWEFSDPEVRNPRSQQLARTYSFGVNVRF